MFSYQAYKVVHLWSILLFLTTMAIGLSAKQATKFSKIMIGISSLTILVGGMGMMARLGIKHGEGWPTWLNLKMIIWLLLSVLGPIFLKKLLRNRILALYFLLSLAFAAVWIVINQDVFAG